MINRDAPTLPPPPPGTEAQLIRAQATQARLRARQEESHARELDRIASSLESRT